MNWLYLLRRVTRRHPGKDAIIEHDRRTTYQQLWQRIALASRVYEDLGVRRGERVLLALPNGADFLVHHFAALRIGAISVPAKTEYGTCEFLAILNDCRPRLFVSCDRWLRENDSVRSHLDSQVRLLSVDDLPRARASTESDVFPAKSSDVATISYSYFGDGYPKGAVLTHGNHIYSVSGICQHVGFNSHDTFLAVLPMPHVFTLSGCVNASILLGGTVVVPSGHSPRAIFSAIDRHRVTVLNAVPAVFDYLARFKRKDEYDASSIRRSITGGDFMPAELQRELEKRLGFQILQGYGLTETLPILCNPPGVRNRHGTLGVPGRKDIEVRIVNSSGEETQIGEIGEIAVKSPTTMSGYLNLPEDTKNVLRKGWLHTGDLGRLDEDGFLHFCGLKKNIFSVYGNKVDPLEIRAILLEHPSIEKANVYLDSPQDQPYRIGSSKMCADVWVTQGHRVSAVQIRTFCRGRVANYKIPEKFAFHPASEQLETGNR